MFCLTPLPAHVFDKLIGRTEYVRKAMKKRGHLQPLIVPSSDQKGDGLWRDQILLAADAVILAALDMLVETGAARGVVDRVMRDIQLEIISRFNALDDGEQVHLALAHDSRRWVVLTAATVAEAINVVADHFATGSGTEPPKVAFYCVPLHQAYATVRRRAEQHQVEFPARIWPTPEELDAGADLLAAVIAPRTSPVIEQWQAMREREASPIVAVS
ncbi:hypothetical protein I6F35_12230 [Bradyrhizobium sp. BRP22]|uniref:hypothetical protein n=1 Tax=Bradyrhizobium sp. BRP22 TaxID=2793821 RepID=UPI001CD3BC72|nr:hypothetical protein [Bradyrhizobium sp. BRP22]MCA1453979.1 hypothetical protein [Bradyrhizobium sp. BRP22]